MIIVELIFNLALLVSVSVLSGFIDFRWKRSTIQGKILQGLLFGLVAHLGMLNPFNFAPGIIFDGRSVVLSLCALFFGPLSGFIAASIAFVYRFSLGGDGVIMGLSVIVSSTAIGAVFNYLNTHRNFKIKTIQLYLIGFLVHLVMVALILAIPSPMRRITFQTLTFTILGIYPIATALIGKILKDQSDSLERRIAELALKESEEKYRNLFENLLLGVSETEPDGKLINANFQFAKMFGYNSPEEMMSEVKNVSQLYANPDDRQRIIQLLGKKGILEPVELEVRRRNGDIIPVLMSDKEVKDSNGKLLRYQATHIDITERKKAELELIEAKEKAEESDRLKSAFLANMSHEIRTPMNGILGFAELLKEPELTGEEQHKYIAVIEKSGERMLNIINDIIDISKIEAGQVKVERSDTDINDLSEFVCNFFAPEIKKKGLTFTCSIPKSENHLIVSTDREKLYAILTNLVKNAIKYTPKGNIEFGFVSTSSTTQTLDIRLSEVDERSRTAELQFYVKDTGIGIPKDRQHAIFDRFVQADIEDIKAMEGAGLGLAISKAYAEMLGGTIRVESEQGKGSVFWLNIPLQQTAGSSPAGSMKKEPEHETPQTFKDYTVLIAEDEVTSDLYLTEILKAEFKNILHASTGTESVELLRKHQNIRFILMDIKMPLMNGHEATRMIRTFNKEVIIIAQTAYALPGDREKALEAGCNDYISKPVKKDLLFSILRQYLTKNTNE